MDDFKTEELKSVLRKLPPGDMVTFNDGYLRVRKIRSISGLPGGNSCRACFFESFDGAAQCAYRDCCIAHKRPDRNSVIFDYTICND